MRSPDEFYYGIEEPEKGKVYCVCVRCGDIIKPDDTAVVIEPVDKEPMRYHERCAQDKLTIEEAAEHFGLSVSGCKGYELEED